MTELRRVEAVFREGEMLSEVIRIDPPMNAGDPIAVVMDVRGETKTFLMSAPADRVKSIRIMRPNWFRS